MSEDSIQPSSATVSGDSNEEIDAELLAEYQREIERHEAAVRMVKQREQEAIEAKMRAAQSQQTVEEMTHKYVNVKQKLDISRQTLRDAKLRSECRERVYKTIDSLRVRAEDLLKKHQNQAASRDESRIKLEALSSMSENARAAANLSNGARAKDFSQTVQELQQILAKNASYHQTTESEEPKEETETQVVEEKEEAEGVKEEEEEEVEVDVDMNAMVARLEAKCANVREELGRMAVSEQYMRTKQAQLVAKRREKEALEAELKAAIREKEAQDMRRKVEELTQLLAMRKAKLKATGNTLEKKANVVEKVEKILNRKERQATYIEKQKIEQLVYEKKVKKL